MMQRSFSPCFFGNKVTTMAFKLIFVFAVIAIFAANAVDVRPCPGVRNKLRVRGVRKQGNTLRGQYLVDQNVDPQRIALSNGLRRTIGGCNRLRPLVNFRVDCRARQGWINFSVPGVPRGEYTFRAYDRQNRLIACFKKDD